MFLYFFLFILDKGFSPAYFARKHGHVAVYELLHQNGFALKNSEQEMLTSEMEVTEEPHDSEGAVNAQPLPRHHEGPLQLFNEQTGEWQEHFAVFDLCVLSFHETDATSPVFKRLPMEILCDATMSDVSPRSFELTTVANKKHLFSAENEEQRDLWLNVLKLNIDAIPEHARVNNIFCLCTFIYFASCHSFQLVYILNTIRHQFFCFNYCWTFSVLIFVIYCYIPSMYLFFIDARFIL